MKVLQEVGFYDHGEWFMKEWDKAVDQLFVAFALFNLKVYIIDILVGFKISMW